MHEPPLWNITFSFLCTECESNCKTLLCQSRGNFFLKLNHFVALSCLESQTANTCPVDRISFAFIHQRLCPGGDVQKKVIILQWSLKVCGNMWAVFGGWTVCGAAADQSEDKEKGRWWWWGGGGEQYCYLRGMWTQRPPEPAASVHTLWFGVWHCGAGAHYTVLSSGILVFNIQYIPVFILVTAVASYWVQ